MTVPVRTRRFSKADLIFSTFRIGGGGALVFRTMGVGAQQRYLGDSPPQWAQSLHPSRMRVSR